MAAFSNVEDMKHADVGGLTNVFAILQRLKAQHEDAVKQLEVEITRLGGLPQGTQLRQAFRFLDLPPELRDMIYELGVSCGKVFPGPHRDHDNRYNGNKRYGKPQWQLLQVSRQVRNEAAKVLFSRNQIVISSQDSTWVRLLGNDGNISAAIETRYGIRRPLALTHQVRMHLGFVSIKLDAGSIGNDATQLMGWLRQRLHFEQLDTQDERTIYTHSQIRSWTGPWEQLCRRAVTPNLRVLVLDLKDCFCSLGCCRFLREAACALALSAERFTESLEVVEIVGTQNIAERRLMCKHLARATQKRFDLPDGCNPTIRFARMATNDFGPVRSSNGTSHESQQGHEEEKRLTELVYDEDDDSEDEE